MVPQVGAWAEFGSNGLVSERLGVTSPTSIYRLGNFVVCFWGEASIQLGMIMFKLLVSTVVVTGFLSMTVVMKKQPTNSCAGCSVTGDGYGGWCYGERMNGPYFWPCQAYQAPKAVNQHAACSVDPRRNPTYTVE